MITFVQWSDGSVRRTTFTPEEIYSVYYHGLVAVWKIKPKNYG